MTQKWGPEMAYASGITFHSKYQESIFEVIYYDRGYFVDFARGLFEKCGHFTIIKNTNGQDKIQTLFTFENKPNAQIFGNLLKFEIGIIPKIYEHNGFKLHYGEKESIALFDYLYLESADNEHTKVMKEWLKYKGISHTYFTFCEMCKCRYIRMHPGDKICKKCRKKT